MPDIQAVGQFFSPVGEYTPTKAAVFLRPTLAPNQHKYFLLDSDVVIDATNYTTLGYGTEYLLLDIDEAGATGKGCMSMTADALIVEDAPPISFPVKAQVAGTWFFSARVKRDGAGEAELALFVDGVEQGTAVMPGAINSWGWNPPMPFTLSDTEEHTLAIRTRTGKIDKIVLHKAFVTQVGDGPAYTESPYLTIHLLVYTLSGDLPDTPLYIHDHKTTLDEVKRDGWYSFSLAFIDNALAVPFDSSYALVMVASGSDNRNSVSWETVDANEYIYAPAMTKE